MSSFCNLTSATHFTGYHLNYSIYNRPRHSCNSLSGQISTEIRVHYRANQCSPDHYIIPARYELFDDFNLRCVWNSRFLFPIKEEDSLLIMLEKF